MNTNQHLPTTPSELIRAALADLHACEHDDLYVVDMEEWHTPVYDYDGEGCAVCLAGAVMAQTLGAPREQAISTHDLAGYGSSVEDGLRALDCFRRGLLKYGLEWLHHDVNELSEEYEQFASEVVYDQADPDEFHDRMHRLADYLASCGL